jgi:serine/threonine protein kinase
MHDLISRLLQTDPNRRPSIEQVLLHPAIAAKVQEFQMLYPQSQSKRIKTRFGQPPKAPLLPVNNKRSSVIKDEKAMPRPRVNMKPVQKKENEVKIVYV